MVLTDSNSNSTYTNVVLPSGSYDFEIKDVKEGTSKKSGKPMYTLQLRIESAQGDVNVFDHIVDMPSMAWKFAGLFKACGQFVEGKEIGKEEMEDLIGCIGRVKLRIEPAQGQYDERNSVVRYEEPEPVPTPKATPLDTSDDLPF